MIQIKWSLSLLIFLLSIGFTTLQAQEEIQSQIFVNGNCGMCKDRIEKTALNYLGVSKAEWNEETKQLALTHSADVDLIGVHFMLAKAGHDTEEVTASDEAYEGLHACCQYRGISQEDEHQSGDESSGTRGDTIHTDIFVDGICDMCKDRIEAAAQGQEHVYSLWWEVDQRILHVDHSADFNQSKLERTIAKAGHDTESFTAPDRAYNNLHECCKYRDEAIIAAHQPDAIDTIGTVDPTLIQGIVLERDNTGKETPLIGANVYWSGTTTGSVTDEDGYFQLDKSAGSELIISYIGYNSDTLAITDQSHVEIVLSDATVMREVTITHKRRSTEVSFLSTGKVQQIGEKELLKAACCNLSESFETNPTVDASATDAVTGTRQIKMLGLAGPNIQITREGIPDIRGLSAIYGLTFIPGTWIEGININTGAGSVVNGFESIAGQIDVSLKKPEHSERLFVNVYSNEMSRTELNINMARKISDKTSTAVLLHGSIMPTLHDVNHDGFLDHPNMEQFVGLNRWKFHGENGLEGQVGFKITKLDSRSGQVDFDHDSDHGSDNLWGSRIQLDKYEGWAKMGKVFPSKPYASIGLQIAASYYDQKAYFGLRDYDGQQSSAYANLIYQSIITDTRHKFKMGMSFQWDGYDENVAGTQFERNETVPGAFFEYSFIPNDRLSLVLGLRGDYHNNYGFFATPRLHMRYAPNETTVFRLSGGRGQRTASIFAENIGAFASSRQFVVQMKDVDNPYGLDAEVSWSAGFSFVKEWLVNLRPLLFQFDVYHTNFQNQIVVDWDASPQTLEFYNLDGESYSNSIQLQVDYEIIPRWDLRLAYRLNDVKTTYHDNTMERPLTSRDRAFINTQYTTKNNWSFDFTLNWQGQQRLPETSSNPEPYQIESYSPSYFMANTQITKSWNKKFDVYIGAMNLFNYRQDNPIISADDPFSEYFDASIIWAPVFGREIYGGIRYKIL